jgi:lipopolysaccharide transport system permease protein
MVNARTTQTLDAPVTVIEASSGWAPIRFRELWQYRETLYFLVWRDIKVRYKQTAIGIAWAIIQPLMTMLVFTVFLGRLAKVPSDGIPYPLFALSALVPWTFFANGLQQSTHSLVSSSSLITKVYFPRLMIPTARILAGVPDLALAFLLLLGLEWHYGMSPILARLLWLPGFVLLAFATALGIGFWLSALNVKFRDVQHAVPFIVQIWLFSSPIAYPSSLVPEAWRTVYALNPMVGVVEGFRWALLGIGRPPDRLTVLVSASVAAALLVTGAFFFRRVERRFADII